MQDSLLISITDAANTIKVSEALVDKFIKLGLVSTIQDGHSTKLTPYGIRRLLRIVDMYDQSFSTDRIENLLNH